MDSEGPYFDLKCNVHSSHEKLLKGTQEVEKNVPVIIDKENVNPRF